MNRAIRASTRSKQLHGVSKPAQEGGVVFEFENVAADQALAAFDAVALEPGTFELITRDETRIAFMFGRGGFPGFVDRLLGRPAKTVTLDIWFEESPDPLLCDVHVVDIPTARKFIENVYRDLKDPELWRILELPRIVA
jgi:hypothetical protein